MHTDMRQIDAGLSLGRGQAFVDSFAPLGANHYVCKGCIVGSLDKVRIDKAMGVTASRDAELHVHATSTNDDERGYEDT